MSDSTPPPPMDPPTGTPPTNSPANSATPDQTSPVSERRKSLRSSTLSPRVVKPDSDDDESIEDVGDYDSDFEFPDVSTDSENAEKRKQLREEKKARLELKLAEKKEKAEKRRVAAKQVEAEKVRNRFHKRLARVRKYEETEAAKRRKREARENKRNSLEAERRQKIEDKESFKRFVEDQMIGSKRIIESIRTPAPLDVQVERNRVPNQIVREICSSDYYQQWNKAREVMKTPEMIEKVVEFAEKASDLEPDHYFASLKDPYYKGMQIYEQCQKISAEMDDKATLQPLDWSRREKMLTYKIWKEKAQKNLRVHFIRATKTDNVNVFCKLIGLQKSWDLERPTTTFLHQPGDRKRELKMFVTKFQELFEICKEDDLSWCPVFVQIFDHVMERIYGNEFGYMDDLDPNMPETDDDQARFVRDLILWLPIHLANLTTGVHWPEIRNLEPARQLLSFVMEKWQDSFSEYLLDEVQIMKRLKLAAARLECSTLGSGSIIQ